MTINPFDPAPETSTPVPLRDGNRGTEVADFHRNSDVDFDKSAQHHTLGSGPNQAAAGDHIHLVGEVIMYAGATVPPGYFGCNGGLFNGLLFPKLAACLGASHGAIAGDFYVLPDYRGRSPVGVGMAVPAVGGNNYTLALKWGDERSETHNHSGTTTTESNFHTHDIPGGYVSPTAQAGFIAATVQAGGSFGFTYSTTQDTGNNLQLHTHIVNNDGTGNQGNVHPVYGTNFIIRAV